MSAAQHTPGPWSFRQIDSDGLGYIEADGRDILHAGVLDRSASENIANSHMAAAAPDLADALTKAESFISGFEGDELQEGIDVLLAEVRTALAKASDK